MPPSTGRSFDFGVGFIDPFATTPLANTLSAEPQVGPKEHKNESSAKEVAVDPAPVIMENVPERLERASPVIQKPENDLNKAMKEYHEGMTKGTLDLMSQRAPPIPQKPDARATFWTTPVRANRGPPLAVDIPLKINKTFVETVGPSALQVSPTVAVDPLVVNRDAATSIGSVGPSPPLRSSTTKGSPVTGRVSDIVAQEEVFAPVGHVGASPLPVSPFMDQDLFRTYSKYVSTSVGKVGPSIPSAVPEHQDQKTLIINRGRASMGFGSVNRESNLNIRCDAQEPLPKMRTGDKDGFPFEAGNTPDHPCDQPSPFGYFSELPTTTNPIATSSPKDSAANQNSSSISTQTDMPSVDETVTDHPEIMATYCPVAKEMSLWTPLKVNIPVQELHGAMTEVVASDTHASSIKGRSSTNWKQRVTSKPSVYRPAVMRKSKTPADAKIIGKWVNINGKQVFQPAAQLPQQPNPPLNVLGSPVNDKRDSAGSVPELSPTDPSRKSSAESDESPKSSEDVNPRVSDEPSIVNLVTEGMDADGVPIMKKYNMPVQTKDCDDFLPSGYPRRMVDVAVLDDVYGKNTQ